MQRECVADASDEEPSLDEHVDDLVRAGYAKMLAELRREAVEGCDCANECPHVGRLAFEDLVREECKERASGTLDEVVECPLAVGDRDLAHGFDRKSDGRGPTPRRFEDDGG